MRAISRRRELQSATVDTGMLNPSGSAFSTLHRRQTRRQFLQTLAALGAVSLVPGEASAAEPRPKIGMNFVGWKQGEVDSAQGRASLRKVLDMGIERVIFVPVAYVSNNGIEIRTDGKTTTPDELRGAIDTVHEAGAEVDIAPLLDRVDRRWRGTIGVGFDDGQRQQFFNNYNAFLSPYLALAAEKKVKRFVFGREYVELSKWTDYWDRLITASQDIYDGERSYGAMARNADDEFTQLEWGSLLTHMGIDEWGSRNAVTWPDRINQYDQVSRRFGGIPISVQELGYRSVQYARAYPGDEFIDPISDEAEQYYGYKEALTALLRRGGLISDINFWLANASGPDGTGGTTHSPIDKYAGRLLQQTLFDLAHGRSLEQVLYELAA